MYTVVPFLPLVTPLSLCALWVVLTGDVIPRATQATVILRLKTWANSTCEMESLRERQPGKNSHWQGTPFSASG